MSTAPYMCSLAGHSYMFDLTKYTRRTLPGLAVQQIATPEGGDADLNREGFWRRSQQRFGYGAGQVYYDEANAERRRFNTSKGIDIWNDRYLQLLHDTERKTASTNTSQLLLQVGNYLYWADGDTLKFTTDPTVASPTWTTVGSPLGGGLLITSLATDLFRVYYTDNSGLANHAKGTVIGSTTFTFTVTVTCEQIGYGNGRLIGAFDNEIFEINGSGAKVGAADIYADPAGAGGAANFTNITATPSAIYAVLTAGSISTVHALYAANVSTAISEVVAGTLPYGETVNALSFYGGVLVIGTTKGIRVATINSDHTITYGQLLTIPGGVSCFQPQGEYMWFGWTNYDGTSTGLGRMNLSINTSADTLVPAYASDIMATAQGAVQGVATFSDKRYFTVAGSGVWGENANLVTSGTINSGWVRYSTLIPKIFSGAQIGFDALVGTVAISIITDDGTTHALGTASTAGTTSSTFFDASNFSGIGGQVVLTLTRATTTTGPTVRYWILDALPVPPRVMEIILPIILGNKVTDMKGEYIGYDSSSEYDFIDGLRRSNALVTYNEGDRTETVRVADLGIDPKDAMSWDELTAYGGRPPTNWFDRVTVSVRLLTKEA